MIYVDADACPVKDEVYRVASRYSMPVAVVANTLCGFRVDWSRWLSVPASARPTIGLPR